MNTGDGPHSPVSLIWAGSSAFRGQGLIVSSPMPTDDFQCTSCGQLFEARVSFGEAEQGTRPACPHCRSTKPRRLLSSTIHILTGKPDTRRPGMSGQRGGGGCGGGSCGCR